MEWLFKLSKNFSFAPAHIYATKARELEGVEGLARCREYAVGELFRETGREKYRRREKGEPDDNAAEPWAKSPGRFGDG